MLVWSHLYRRWTNINREKLLSILTIHISFTYTPRRLNIKFEMIKFEMIKFEMRKFEMRKFEMRKFEMRKFEMRKFEMNKF